MFKVELRNLREFSSTRKESLRAIRTNITFCGDDVKTILITSALPSEGKSTVTIDLARSLAEAGKKVLVIDTDMRKSVMITRLKAKKMIVKSEKPDYLTNIYGLSHLLSGQSMIDDVMYRTQLPNMYIIFSGPNVPNPTEILDKPYFKSLISSCREQFDYILIDCAPLSAAIDAAVVAKQCDGAILVVAQNSTSAKAVAFAKKQLEMAGVPILGAVLNKVKKNKKGGYGNYYGNYYGTYYGNYGDGEAGI